MKKKYSVFLILSKKIIWPEASVIEDQKHEAEINFGRAVLRPHRQVVFLDYPNINLLKNKNISVVVSSCK